MKIYTKSGDEGESSLIGGDRESKAADVFDVLGNLDELNASLGYLQLLRVKEVKEVTLKVQNDLFELGALIADDKATAKDYSEVAENTSYYEHKIDEFETELEPLKNFVIPGGSLYSSHLHISRAICRRTERKLVRYYQESKREELKETLKYLNRLSDLLFVLARYTNSKLGVKDQLWESN